MRNLIDFVNHGVLPFAGRREVEERLFAFWQETRDSYEARALLLVGEAGMGKSRVLEELIPNVRRAEGVVVHVKLYVDSTTALAPLVAQALWGSEGGRKLLREEPEKTIPSVVAALRRLTRLRPVLLIVEDLHLLGSDAIADFMALFNGVVDEPISLICAARPGELPARGILAPYLVADVLLEGLTRAELSDLWLRFFEATPDSNLIDLFLQHTHGNPMALRTALRNALRSGALARNDVSGTWELTIPVSSFSDKLAEDVRLFSGGMTAHLSPSEKSAAALLATLGETFSKRSSARLLGDESRRIEALMFKGIVSNLGTISPPLCGNYDPLPLFGFTHSLIHDYLLQENVVDPDRLLEVVGYGDPVCSTVPYRLLRDHAGEIAGASDIIRPAIDRIVENVLQLESTADWRNGVIMLEAAEMLFRQVEGTWSKADSQAFELKLLASRLRLCRRENHTEEYAVLVTRFREATTDIPDELAKFRLESLTYWYGQLRRGDYRTGFRAVWDEVEDVLGKYPELRATAGYIEFLQVAGRTTNVPEDVAMNPLVDERLHSILNDPGIPERIKHRALWDVAPLLLWRFSSQEELAERLELLQKLQEIAGESIWVRTRAIAFYEGIGRHKEVLELGDDMISLLRSRDMQRDLAQVRLLRLAALTTLGVPADRIDPELAGIVVEAPNEIQSHLKRMIARRFVGLALSRGDTAWARRVMDVYGADTMTGSTEELMLAVDEGNGMECLRRTGNDPRILETCGSTLVGRLLGMPSDPDRLRAEIAERLAVPFYIRIQVLDRHLLISLTQMLGDADLEDSLRDEIRISIRDAFEWLHQRELPALGIPLLERTGRYFSAKEKTLWAKRFTDLIERRAGVLFAEEENDQRIEISVIGDVSIKRPGEPRGRVRGGRLRTVLGLLVANEILPASLSYREFCRLASGGEDDPERARKMSSMGLLRLREAYGDEIVNAKEGESPSLNLERVRVDLLEALSLTHEALREVREGLLMRAHPAMHKALELLNGEVPFPALYDDFFEAIRQDIDYLVREGILDVGRALVRESDHIIAEQILRLAVRVMPHDEEIVDLLSEVLMVLGKRTEAERLKMRQEDLEHGW